MKQLRIAWDAPASYDPDYYEIRWLGHIRETHGTETVIDVPDDFAGRIAVVAVENGIASEPCVVWYEEFNLFVAWDDKHRCVIVSLPTSIERRYVIERKVDQGEWAEFADFLGTGSTEQVGGGNEKFAVFRAWSRAI